MVEDKLNIDPWSSTQSTDYSRIIDQFGLSNFNNLTLPNPSHLHRRGIVFAHRDFDLILNAQKNKIVDLDRKHKECIEELAI